MFRFLNQKESVVNAEAPESVVGLSRSHVAQLMLVCLLCTVTRLVAFRYDVISDDEAIYYTMGRVVQAGGVMYQDSVDHKPPGLTYVYAGVLHLAHFLGGTAAGIGMNLIHLLGIFVSIGTCLLLFTLARRILAPPLWIMPSLLYAAVSVTKQPVDGLAVNGEMLGNVPVAAAMLCALLAGSEYRSRRFWLDFSAGALCALATFFKFQFAVALTALPFLLIDAKTRERPLKAIHRLITWGIGFVTPLALAALYFWHRGAFQDAVQWGLLFNHNYISEGPDFIWALERFGMQFAGLIVPGFLLYAGGIITLVRMIRRAPQRDVIAKQFFLIWWTVVSMASVAVGSRFFGHYFLQAELPLALLAAGPAYRLGARRRNLALGIPLLLYMIMAVLPEVSQPYLNKYDPDYHAIGRAVAERTSPKDTIWIWGNVAQIYWASDRLPGVRFTWCNFLTGLSPATRSEYEADVDPSAHALTWAWNLVIDDLERNRPALILDTAAAGIKAYGKFPISRYPKFADYMEKHYRRETSVSGIVFYRRVDGA